MFNLPEDLAPRSPQAPLPVPAKVTGVRGVTHSFEKGEVGCFPFGGYRTRIKTESGNRTHNELTVLVVDILL